jgi:hypothetical protein
MQHQNGCPTGRSQEFTLPDSQVVVSRASLREVLSLLSFATPMLTTPAAPERHWSALKTMKLVRAKKLLRRALNDG